MEQKPKDDKAQTEKRKFSGSSRESLKRFSKLRYLDAYLNSFTESPEDFYSICNRLEAIQEMTSFSVYCQTIPWNIIGISRI